jgi:hypothetical protein
MNIFGHPYWRLDSTGKLTPVVPDVGLGSVPEISPMPADLKLLPTILPTVAPGMLGTPFMEVVVKNCPLGGSLITWGLKRDFCDPLPYRFDVFWSETPTGDYERVDTPVLVNTYWAVDPAQRLWALDIESYYAVRMTTPNGEYWAYAANANSPWRKKDWLIAREICRKEFLMFRKFTGWDGFLLKRRVWGSACSRCKDFDTNEPSDGHCLTCFGTGKEGGYWPPFPTFVHNMGDGPTQFKQADDNTSLSENLVLQGMRILGYPHLATNDVFLHYGSGRRYFVRPVKVAAEIKGIPIIWTCELRQAPYTDVIYKFPQPPVVPPEPPEPPTPESEPTYVQPPVLPVFRISWVDGEWQLGKTGQAPLYRTTGGYPMANALDSFTWAPDGLSVSEQDTGYVISGSDVVAGLYMPRGDYAGLPVFEIVRGG